MHSLKLKKEKYKEKKRKEKKRKKEERKGKKEEKETFVFKTVCWCNIAGTLNICLVLTY